MLSYCFKFRKNTESTTPKVARTKKKKLLLSKSAVYNSKKSNFIKQQEANPLLSSLRINTTINKNTLLRPLLF